MKTLKVLAQWDDEAEVWVAVSDDVPGLVTEAESIDKLMAKLKVMIPEMLDENGHEDDAEAEVLFELLASCRSTAQLHHH